MRFTLHIPGKPMGKGRPRFGNGRTFTPKETVFAENEIRRVWQEAGEPFIDGPVTVEAVLCFARPNAHFKTNGQLNAQGLRFPCPSRSKPDIDNSLKLIFDSLNGLAYRDDVQVVEAWVRKEWAMREKTIVTVSSWSQATVGLAVAA